MGEVNGLMIIGIALIGAMIWFFTVGFPSEGFQFFKKEMFGGNVALDKHVLQFYQLKNMYQIQLQETLNELNNRSKQTVYTQDAIKMIKSHRYLCCRMFDIMKRQNKQHAEHYAAYSEILISFDRLITQKAKIQETFEQDQNRTALWNLKRQIEQTMDHKPKNAPKKENLTMAMLLREEMETIRDAVDYTNKILRTSVKLQDDKSLQCALTNLINQICCDFRYPENMWLNFDTYYQ